MGNMLIGKLVANLSSDFILSERGKKASRYVFFKTNNVCFFVFTDGCEAQFLLNIVGIFSFHVFIIRKGMRCIMLGTLKSHLHRLAMFNHGLINKP